MSLDLGAGGAGANSSTLGKRPAQVSTWSCLVCTFENKLGDAKCEMCDTQQAAATNPAQQAQAQAAAAAGTPAQQAAHAAAMQKQQAEVAQ